VKVLSYDEYERVMSNNPPICFKCVFCDLHQIALSKCKLTKVDPMGAYCKKNPKMEVNFVTGEVTTKHDWCKDKNVDGDCVDYAKSGEV